MAKDAKDGKGASGAGAGQGPEWRRMRAVPRTLGAVLPSVTAVAFRRKSGAASRLMMDWAIVVGPRLSQVTEPRRVSAGTLTLACSGPVAMELQHLAPQLIERINRHMGQEVVQRLRLVQDASIRPPPVRVPRKEPVPHVVPGVEDDGLRDALGRLGARIAARAEARGGDRKKR